MIETCFVLPKFAHGQFLSIFNSIFSSIQNDIGGSLSAINQIAQQVQKLYQTTVAPHAARHHGFDNRAPLRQTPGPQNRNQSNPLNRLLRRL
jgi:hypothetical protein